MVWIVACASGQAPIGVSSVSTSGTGGGGGSDLPCGVDCSKFEVAQCAISVCNTGQVLGPLNTCVAVAAPDGTACDDGLFCTVKDSCVAGKCNGGDENDCGMGKGGCIATICYEDLKACDGTPVDDGAPCTPEDLCRVDGVCHLGECAGVLKDCSFSPLSECNKVACDSATGKCVGLPDPTKDDAPCVLTGDLCRDAKTCKTGVCGGGVEKDCSAFNVGCEIGACASETGFCSPAPAPVGTACSDGIPECSVGKCDSKGSCLPSAGPDGVSCNDHNSCTQSDICAGGTCSGSPVTGCQLYLYDGFETCSNGWTFGGDWQCGKPTNVGPSAPHSGSGLIGTKISGAYSLNQSFDVAVADSPPINLTGATKPVLSFWAWDHTEGGTFDGWNIKVSADGGQTFTLVNPVIPGYPIVVGGQPAWGGDHSLEGWQNHTADLSTYAGQTIILRYAFRSDGATVFPGVYIDDVIVSEPLQNPIYITTPSILYDVYAGKDYTAQIVKTGGTSSVVWSIKGGTNIDWLFINPTTGVLYGAPSAMEVGPVSVTVHVEESALPSNFAEKTFVFNVINDVYYTSFEGTCPDGWTLTGDWQCGVPASVGPSKAYVGTQCLATQIGGLYTDLQTFAATTATSPDIDLSQVGNPILTFRMWVDTEGATYDGFNLQVSDDGGMNFAIVDTVTPAYPLTVAGKPAWGGHQAALGWQLVSVNLSAYAGKIIRLRYAFQSDSSGTFAGVYIDDIFIE